MSEKTKEFEQDFTLMIEAGFVAVKQLDETSATRIFQAAQALHPHHTAPQVGMGYIALSKLDLKEGIRIFESVLNAEPENHLAQTFLGLCYILSKTKRKKGEKLIESAVEKTTDPTVKNLGIVSLDWSKNELAKKVKSPFFTDKKTEPEEEEEE